MLLGDKAKDVAQKVAGHAEEFVGKKTDDKELTAQGQKDKTMGEARKNVEDVKDDLGKEPLLVRDKVDPQAGYGRERGHG